MITASEVSKKPGAVHWLAASLLIVPKVDFAA